MCFTLGALAACAGSPPATSSGGEPRRAGAHSEPDAGPIPSAWVERRAAEAEARLGAAPGGQAVLRAIEAHGGLRRGLGTGTLQFGFDYRPLGQPDRRMNTLNELDVWRARAVHTERGEGANAVLGWDGRHAWFTPKPEAFPSPARFWALTPYYFVGMPFVLADPGVQFERLPDVELEGAQFTAVRVTFAPGTGGASDDYYILSLGQADARLNALRYVVSYPGFFPQGGHSPEKLMRYSEPVTVGGLIFAGRLDTYAFDPPTLAPKEKVTDIVVDGLALGAPIPGARFSPPPSAVLSGVLEGR